LVCLFIQFIKFQAKVKRFELSPALEDQIKKHAENANEIRAGRFVEQD
jgi:hypothetical protein